MFTSGVPGLDYGYMTCDAGNMFGGKSDNLIRRVKRIHLQENLRREFCESRGFPFRPLKIGVFIHAIDKRYSDGSFIVTHNGLKLSAIPVGSPNELASIVDEKRFDVVVIDEIQFFQEKNPEGEWAIVTLLHRFINEKKFVLVAGLEKDFRGLPFGPTGDLMALADEKMSHSSMCTVCGNPAILPQRFVNGEPAFEDDAVILVGAKESYEPRCRRHHVVRKREEAPSVLSLS